MGNQRLESYGKGKAPPVGPFRPFKKSPERVSGTSILSGGFAREHVQLSSRTN